MRNDIDDNESRGESSVFYRQGLTISRAKAREKMNRQTDKKKKEKERERVRERETGKRKKTTFKRLERRTRIEEAKATDVHSLSSLNLFSMNL